MAVSYFPEQIERIVRILEGTDTPPDPIKSFLLREYLALHLPELAERSLEWRDLEESDRGDLNTRHGLMPKAERNALVSAAYFAKMLRESLGKLPEATVIRINIEMGKRLLGEQQDLPGLMASGSTPYCQGAMDTIDLLKQSIDKALEELPQVKRGRPEGESWLFRFIKDLRWVYEDITGFRAGITWSSDNNVCGGRYADFVRACVEPFWTQQAGSTLDNLIRRSTKERITPTPL